MNRIASFTRRVFDIRPGEHLQLWAMFLYLMFVLFAYYIVKPVSRAMFLTKFDIDKLPLLYILIAVFGGIFAYFYSKLATKVSLSAAVTWAMGLSAAILVVLWWLIRLHTVSIRIRRQIPRVLKNLPDQRSVSALLPAIGHADLTIRSAVLTALNQLRETAPGLNIDDSLVTNQLLKEAREYYETSAALAPFRELPALERPALKLLSRTIEHKLKETMERLFGLLGLRYPPKDIYRAYLAVSKPTQYDVASGLEFLDNLLDRDIKRVLLPLLDAPQNLLDRGHELFGIRKLSLEEAIRVQIRSSDPWLAACAMAAAAELQIRSLAPDIVVAGREGTAEISRVAHSAQMALA